MKGLRFLPPPLTLDSELEWVLLRALGPLDATPPERVSGDGAWRLARVLDLAPRIGCRIRAERLRAEVGPDVAARFTDAYHQAAALNLLNLAVAREVAVAAGEQAIPVMFLKSTALLWEGVSAIGTRNAADIDVLAARNHVVPLMERLRAQGFAGGADGYKEHQLAPAYHPSGLTVEVHTAVKGLRLQRGHPWAEAAELMTPGDALRVDGESSPVWLPGAPLAAAHAVIHVVVQHGAHPGTYPHLRVLTDLADLDAGGAVFRGRERLEALACATVRAEEIDSVLSLVSALRAGEMRAIEQDAHTSWWLRHALASLSDHDYQEYLRIPGLMWDETNLPGPVGIARRVWVALSLPRIPMEARYGSLERSGGLSISFCGFCGTGPATRDT
jgi:hypothetical protein